MYFLAVFYSIYYLFPLECEEWIFKKWQSVQDWWSALEQKYKDLVFKLVDYINENIVPEIDKESSDFWSQTEPQSPKYSEIEYKLKKQYEDLVEESSCLK